MKEIIEITDVQAHILDSLKPFYGESRAEVIINISMRWIEEHIGTESMKQLQEIGAIGETCQK